ncbi:MAG TPA: flagellar motor protein MotB [Candidatus Acidoferrales bacterium]|nr:flagellar motor protein MotB [Bryobacteraceae bacterium]HTS67148.1 flagellar motor protein MotB [Candidatus Acidoferrales bacterium]
MTRHKAAEHENHERWLVSYADFITLLFAFFVVMFASTQADKNKAKAVSDSVREALEHGQFSTAISTVLGRGKHEAKKPPATKDPSNERENTPPPPPPPGSHPPDLARSLVTLQQGLDAELKNGKLQLKLEPRGLVISMREATFFASGDDTIAPASFPILAKIAAVVQDLPNPVRLEGHTDSRPIHNSRFHSNWDLSSARSIAMLELFRDRFQIPSSRMSVAGYADNAPTDSNETEEGRAHNRRVDLVLLSTSGMASEPPSRAAPNGTVAVP